MNGIENPTRIVFGVFEADLQAGELWKAGFRLHLQSQPFKVLVCLLQRPGEVITRQELQNQVWGTGTTVDFERALAGAINKVRDALGDSADNPRFVETLAKRGYRFIAPVSVICRQSSLGDHDLEQHDAVDSGSVAANVDSNPEAVERPSALLERQPRLRTFIVSLWSRLRRRELIVGCGLTALLLILAAFILWPKPQHLPLRIEQLTYNSPISPGPPNAESLPTMATDGDRIITSVLADGRPQLAAIYIATGEVQRMTVPQELASVSSVGLSRDGSRLLVLSRLSSASEQPLWVVPTGGGSAFRVGNIFAHDATWMPDGNAILYASGDDLAIVHLENGKSTPWVTLPGRAFWPRWSPDGKLLRFTLSDPLKHTQTLWEIHAGSNVPHPLQELRGDESTACCGVWTADGSSYVFQKFRDNGSDLWALRKQGFGSNLVQLTNGPIRCFAPIAARSGHQIFFLGSDISLGLQRFDPVRHEFVPEQAFLEAGTRVNYSRDGKWVAWTDSNERLWRARSSDGAEKLQLTPANMEVFSAQWSPDGKRLALMARMPGQVWQIYLVDASGGELRQALHEERNSADPTWSADGRLLAFGREPDLMGKEGDSHSIQILDIEKQSVTTLPKSDGLFSPRWSPDGRWIAALTLDQRKVMLFDMQTRTWKELAETSAADPVWRNDSKSLYVHAFQASKEPILRFSVPDGTSQSVADLSDLHMKGAANYFFGGLTPDNQVLVLPKVGTSDLYMLDLDH